MSKMKKAPKENPFAKKGKLGEKPEGEKVPKEMAMKAKAVPKGKKPPFFAKKGKKK